MEHWLWEIRLGSQKRSLEIFAQVPGRHQDSRVEEKEMVRSQM
jgi:hypothetical protein